MKRKRDYIRELKYVLKMKIKQEKELWRRVEKISSKTPFSTIACRSLYEDLKDLEIPENKRFYVIERVCDFACEYSCDFETALKEIRHEVLNDSRTKTSQETHKDGR